MPIELDQRAKITGGILLLVAAPLLLFPHRFPLGTLFALLLILAFWLWPIPMYRSMFLPVTPVNASLLLFLLMVFVGILVTAIPELTLSKATGLVFGISLWRYLVLHVHSRLGIVWAASGYILLGLAFMLVGFLNANWILKTSSRVPFINEYLVAIFNQLSITADDQAGIHPNQISGTITLFFPLLVALLVSKFNFRFWKSARIILAFLVFLALIALLLTQSRSGWFGILVGLLFLVLLRELLLPPSVRRSLILLAVGMVFLAGFIIILLLGPEGIRQVWLDPPTESVVGSFTTLNFRQELWPWAVEGVNSFPFTGMGLGTFRIVVRNLYPVAISPNFDIAHAHNIFLQVALDVGIPGLIAYLSLLILSIFMAWKVARNDQELQTISIGLLACLVAFHVFGLVDALALGSKTGLLFWANLGLLTAMIRFRTNLPINSKDVVINANRPAWKTG